MISIVNLEITEYVGLSTDTKPTGNVANGSTFIEMDTGHVYWYDKASGDWIR